MNISYDSYRTFFYVARYQSFTRAAAALLSSQPNVTRTIKHLESALGCTLFIRSNRGVRLTGEGETLYAHVQAAVEQLQAGEEALSRETRLERGRVFLIATEIALRCFLLPVLNRFRLRCPGVRLHISSTSTPQALTALKNGAADLALVTSPTGELRALRAWRVAQIQEVAVCGRAYGALAERTLSLRELAALPIISLGAHTKTRAFYSDWFSRHGLPFQPEIEAATADQILPMAQNNLGIGFVPREFLTGGEGEDLLPLHLEESVPARSICLVKRSGQVLGAAARALERMILENAAGDLPPDPD